MPKTSCRGATGGPVEVPDLVALVAHFPGSQQCAGHMSAGGILTVPSGRWGFRLFESHQDLDTASLFNRHDVFVVGGHRINMQLSYTVNQHDITTTPAQRMYMSTAIYTAEIDLHMAWCRFTLDTGIGHTLLNVCRARENVVNASMPGRNGKYLVIMAGALLMRVGAVIRADHLAHLRQLAEQVNCSTGQCTTKQDWGFRAPGKAQFLAALANYKEGVPRRFDEPSCFQCGKIASDTVTKAALLKCAKCQRAFYCDTNCQIAQWSAHKRSCITPENRTSVFV